jgi:hypothetical protein
MKKLLVALFAASLILPVAVFARQIQLLQKNLFTDTTLTAYYRMEGNSNTSVGSANGTDTAMSYSANFGLFGQGASFNGSTAKIGLPVNAFTMETSTLVFWMNTTSTADNVLFYFGNVGGSQIDYVRMNLAPGSGGALNKLNWVVVKSGGPGDSIINSSLTVNDGNWHCVGLVKNGVSGTMYVDGSSANGGTNGAENQNGEVGDQRAIGYFALSNILFYSGWMDDVSIFYRPLTAAEVSNICTSRSFEGKGISR